MMVLSVLYKQTLCAMKSRIVEEVGWTSQLQLQEA